jgi:D-glycero-alpha-D-manno-heptose-7-phosphate kinase
MIVTRTPFRITLGGGGTDLPSFYESHGGYILAAGIDKYMYVALNVPLADRLVRLHYSQSETVTDAHLLRHELAREALVLHGVNDAIEIASLADLPAGTGLGSSSCYLVGLLNALRAYCQIPTTSHDLAEEACAIELDTLKKPIGKQDQYMAAYGGLTELVIDRDGTVTAKRLELSPYTLAEFVSKTHLYYTNVRRDTTDILKDQNQALRSRQLSNGKPSIESSLVEIAAIGREIGKAVQAGNFDQFGHLMHDHWLAKKRMSAKITVDAMEELYDHVRREYGVTGGKVAGAGGGGFMMLYCPRGGHVLTEFMAGKGFARLDWGLDFTGSRVVSNLLVNRSVPFHPQLRTQTRM